ncbi:hypothetical protein RhiirA5_415783 [Rhizophagus irregularis]|uniref:VHS domain-containing protein n=5 Tax=Rhizophagus irregularis TaxID=588596 RepID=A0A2I1EWM3_9GLOM|nr:hypothetical protein GLOIN_2v1754646 [Rhizophagus irregularis DAOM 181602=DAOM 197198]EXX51009.1 Hse1p [Rhizophagus irregularis DAOM 197198w]PKC09356.1 hypothetical protein RhiirA5_415783 [Rhizophagus irregularis]PKC66457.1 hypothetical protein RhiirA1_535601 [Rhizophagus irregularis]PKY26517.1 hypothetical protein RhiirB3_528639 [Rhizophagus irregularis]PKY46246.1 hypothetical protein RhiirA4_402244 [Rhizophagus irregularis]|eukprot:XP_025174403.1 hypothetical protein GLOIN_2v1754646 [Rhizophagus irregularis DAOM 181602=DAOM 197198]
MSAKVIKDKNTPNINFKKFNYIIKRIKRIKMGIFDIKSKTIVTDYLEQCVNKNDDDWNLIINTCDAVNATENGAKEATKFIRKKISKSGNVQLRTLTVLKAMTENCGAKFHAEIASKKFLDEIEIVAISPNTDDDIKQKIVTLLGTLTEMFRNEPSLYQISNLYSKLTGIRVSSTQKSSQLSIQQNNISNEVSTKVKISETIEISKNNIQLFTQTLSFTDPEKEDITKNELIQEFYTKCKSLHQSIMNYLSEIQDEQWIDTLLALNQDFVNSFKMYEDMIERGQVKIAKHESQKQSFRGSHLNNLDFDDAGVGSSSSYNPFEDSNEVEYDPVVSGPSAKALGKMPASRFYDSTPNRNSSNNNNNNYSSSYNENQNKTSSIFSETQKVPASLYNDTTLFDEDEPSSESQQQYSNIDAPLEPARPPNGSNNINGRHEHIVI